MIFSSHVICSSSPKSASMPRFKPSYISQDLQSDFLFGELKKHSFLSVRIPEVPLGFVRRTWRDIREKKICRATRSYSSVSDWIVVRGGNNNRTRGKSLQTFFLLSFDMCLRNKRNTLRHLLGSLSFFWNISTEPGNKTLLDVPLRMLLETSSIGFVFLDAGGIRWSAGSLSSMALALNTRKTRLDNYKNCRLNCF